MTRINSPLAIKRRRLVKEWTPELTKLRKQAHKLFNKVFPDPIKGYTWLRSNFSSDHFSLMNEAELKLIIKILSIIKYEPKS